MLGEQSEDESLRIGYRERRHLPTITVPGTTTI